MGLHPRAVALLLLAACATPGTVATRWSPRDGNIAANPRYEQGRGVGVTGLVVGDYKDDLVVDDGRGHIRHFRIRDDTRYYAAGRMVPREYLAPGSRVRTWFQHFHREMIALEVIILHDAGGADPLDWPDRIPTVP